MFEYIKNTLDVILDSVLKNQYIYFYLPFFVLILGFLSVSSPLGIFIPIGVIVIGIFAFCVNNIYLFALVFISLFMGNLIGLISGYFLGKKYCNGFICKIGEKYKNVENAFGEIDKYMKKYNYLAIPLLINLAFIKPFVAMYLGSRNYDFKKFIQGSIIASFTYTLIKATIGFLVGYFGKIVFDYLQIGYKYLIYGFIAIIVLGFIIDFFSVKKDIE